MRGRGANDGLQWRPRFISTRLHQWRPSRTARPVPKVTIKAGHVRPIWAGHPWVYAQAVDHIEGGATAGDEVDVVDPRGQWLGRGLYSPDSAISVRLFTRTKSQGFTKSLIEQRLIEALVRRKALGWPSSRTNAFRWINGEGDDMPGLIVDRFGDAVVVQLTTVGVKRREQLIFDCIENAVRPSCIIDRSSSRLAQTEKIAVNRGIVRGNPDLGALAFLERAFEFSIPLELSQKTGYYLDQRSLRGRIEQLSQGRSVFDAFCYVGPFALAAARGGATKVTAVDSSPVALEVAADLAARNRLSGSIAYEHNDALDALKHAGRNGGYDLVICDPPQLAPSRASRERGHLYMQKMAAAGCQAVTPGGYLVLCSCSAAIGLSGLTRALALGAREVNLVPRVVERWFQGPDHPVLAPFPEGLYLSAIVAEISAIH